MMNSYITLECKDISFFLHKNAKVSQEFGVVIFGDVRYECKCTFF